MHKVVLRGPDCYVTHTNLQVEVLKRVLHLAFSSRSVLPFPYVEECKGVKMIRLRLRRCVKFTLLLAMCVAGALGPARAEAALPRTSQVSASPDGIAIPATVDPLPMAGIQRCSGAIDATGTRGAGIGRLIDVGHCIYDFVLQLMRDDGGKGPPSIPEIPCN